MAGGGGGWGGGGGGGDGEEGEEGGRKYNCNFVASSNSLVQSSSLYLYIRVRLLHNIVKKLLCVINTYKNEKRDYVM